MGHQVGDKVILGLTTLALHDGACPVREEPPPERSASPGGTGAADESVAE